MIHRYLDTGRQRRGHAAIPAAVRKISRATAHCYLLICNLCKTRVGSALRIRASLLQRSPRLSLYIDCLLFNSF